MTSSSRIAGKIAVITGAASGIGSAICARFASEGANLILVDRNQQKLRQTYKEITCNYGKDHLFDCGDVSSPDFVQKLFTCIKENYNGPSDVLVNCAGITRDSLFLKMKEDHFDDVIQVNLKSVFLMTQAFVASLKSQDGMKSASIINISSIVGKSGNIGQANYAASKASVIGFTKTVGAELGRFGVRCNAVLPGFIKTPMTDAVPQEQLEKMKMLIPMKRMGTVEEVANVCLFLASDESSYVNCASLEVTGGLMA